MASAPFHVRTPNRSSGIFSLKLRTEDTPSASDGSLVSSSQASSSDFDSAALEQSISRDDQPISYTVVSGIRFGYQKIMASHIPKGWSNDPQDLEGVSGESFCDYNLDGTIVRILASDVAIAPRRYLFSNYDHFFFWIPSISELLYVTECYNLEGTLERINDRYELRSKLLPPLVDFSQQQTTYLSLWFWQIPRVWSQNKKEFENLKEVISYQDYGLPLPVPILVNDKSHQSIELLMKCGDEFYLFCEISHDILHVDEPSELRGILSVLKLSDLKNAHDPKVTPLNRLPEYGGPNVVDDSNVPSGWSNKIDRDVSCTRLFNKHDIYGSEILLFWHGSPNDAPKCMVEEDSSHYIWDTISNEIWRIIIIQGLQDILDILGGGLKVPYALAGAKFASFKDIRKRERRRRTRRPAVSRLAGPQVEVLITNVQTIHRKSP